MVKTGIAMVKQGKTMVKQWLYYNVMLKQGV